MDAGYFPTTYFAHEYFPVVPQYFPEYGSVAPPTPSTPAGNKWVGRAILKQKPSLQFLLACKQFFEAELGE